MSEQKIWVEKMPEYCDECPCSLRGKGEERWQRMNYT